MRTYLIFLLMILNIACKCQVRKDITSHEYKSRALVMIRNKNYTKALEYLDSAIIFNPKYDTAYYDRGVLKRIIGKYEESLLDINKAIELNPNDSEYVFVRGLIELKLKQYKNAKTDFDKVIEKNNGISEPFNQRGLALDYLDKWQEALNDFDKAIKIDSIKPDYYINRAIVKMKVNDYEGAEADCNNAFAIDTSKHYEADIYYNRGLARKFIKGKNELAAEDLMRAMKLGQPDAIRLLNEMNKK